MDDYIVFTNENLKFIRERITQLRLRRDMSERELSLAIGKSGGYIQNVCSGVINPSLVPLLEIICYFDLTPEEFFNPGIHNSDLWNQTKTSLTKLSDDDLKAILSIIQRMPPNSKMK